MTMTHLPGALSPDPPGNSPAVTHPPGALPPDLPGNSPAVTLEELLRQRAADVAALLDAELPVPSTGLGDPEVALPSVDLLACSARELAWLQGEGTIALIEKQTTRTIAVPHALTGVVTPFEPSMLTVMYTARYFLATRASAGPLSPRDTYVIYGATRCALLADGLQMLGITNLAQPA